VSSKGSIDGILAVDEQSRILSYNRRFVEMWRLPPKLVEDGLDEPVLQFVTVQLADPPSFLQRAQYLYEHKQETSRDELVPGDGRVFDHYSTPMFGPQDRYYGRVWYFREITDRKQAEEEKSKIEAQLNQAQKMESVGRLAGGVAHDFNNMLGVILGHTEIVIAPVDPAQPLFANLEQIRMAANRSADLTRQLLAESTPGEAIRPARERAREIHLLMTDLVMPEMNGRDLVKNLLSLYPNLRRLFMSGYRANVIAHHSLLDEGVYFIQKPFSIKELAAKVREALGGF
jgi:CheY-like chemotaxis protein